MDAKCSRATALALPRGSSRVEVLCLAPLCPSITALTQDEPLHPGMLEAFNLGRIAVWSGHALMEQEKK